MLKQLLAPQFVVLYVLAACTIYVHFRGRQRLRIARQLGDHSTYLLFCDVERPMKYGFMTAINRWVSHHIVKASATQNVDGENVGVLNKVFGGIYEVHLAGQRVKKWNRKVYYALKYSLTAVILGLIVASALR